MSISYSSVHKAQLLIECSSSFSKNASSKAFASLCEQINKQIETSLKSYPSVSIDKDYQRYGLDIGLTANDMDELQQAAEEIMKWVAKHDHLKTHYAD